MPTEFSLCSRFLVGNIVLAKTFFLFLILPPLQKRDRTMRLSTQQPFSFT
ncbi:MAG: hypothetical protein ACFCU7_15020 [Pleurocapsa sp.]